MSTHESLKGNNYSPMELAIFKALLKKQGNMTSTDLMPKVYTGNIEAPIHAGIVLSRAIITLGMKLERNKEAWRIERTTRPNKLRGWNNRLVPAKRAKNNPKSKARVYAEA
jgi:hypothetical protein